MAATALASSISTPLRIGTAGGGLPLMQPLVPIEPASLRQTGCTVPELEGLCVRYFSYCGTGPGRAIADNIELPFSIVTEILNSLKEQLLVVLRETAPLSDYMYELTEQGLINARRRAQHCTY